MITEAIKVAQNEHVVYFLLTSYLEARGRGHEGSALPAHAKRLPIAGETDVRERLHALSEAHDGEVVTNPSPILNEVVDVLGVASQRIAALQSADGMSRSWNVVERTRGGHVRRRRLGWRMTDREAAEWSAHKGMHLERADEPVR